MKDFLRPTKAILLVFGALLLFAFSSFIVRLGLGFFGLSLAETPEFWQTYEIFIFFNVLDGFFKLCYYLGLPVGLWIDSGDWFNPLVPNVFGWLVMVSTILIVSYVLACVFIKIYNILKIKITYHE